MIYKANKRKDSGMYQILTIHDDGLRITGRKKPQGFGKKKSKTSQKRKVK